MEADVTIAYRLNADSQSWYTAKSEAENFLSSERRQSWLPGAAG
jgi:hypothetical protein